MADFDVQQVVEAAARALSISNDTEWDFTPYDPDDVYMRDARAALAVIVPAVTEQIRALHQIAPHEGAPGWLWCHGCRHSVSAEAKVCPTLRLCDKLEAAVRADS